MTWERACDGVDRMLREVRNPIYVPQTGLSFETIFYLMGLGFNLDFIKNFMESCRDRVIQGLGDPPVESTNFMAKLCEMAAAERNRVKPMANTLITA